MGTCYSNQARSGKRTYPSDMSLSSTNSTPKGAKSTTSHGRPAFGYKGKNIQALRNSNEQPQGPDDRSVLTLLDRTKGTKNDANRSSNRFGFKSTGSKGARADTNSNIMSNSSDSLDSLESDKRKNSASTGSSRKGPLRPNTFLPREADRWKMIDDSSTTVSMSTLNRSCPNSNLNSPDNPDMKLFPVDANGNSPPEGTTRGTYSDSASGSFRNAAAQIEKKFGSKMLPHNKQPASASTSGVARPTGLKVPEQKDKWIKAGPVDGEGQKASRNAINTKKKFGFFSKIKNDHKSSQNMDKKKSMLIVQKPQDNRMESTQAVMSTSQNTEEEDEGEVEKVLCKDATREKTMTESLILEEGAKAVKLALDEAVMTPEGEEKDLKTADEETVVPKKSQTAQRSAPLQGATARVDDDEDEPRSESSDRPRRRKSSAPLAKMDSVETSSIGSINSDDLMLDLDIDIDLDDDLPNQSAASLDRSVFLRPRAKSKDSIDSQGSGLSPASKLRPAPIRRPASADMSGTGAIPRRQGSLKGASRSRGNSTSDAVAELSNMMTDSPGPPATYMQAIQRRNPRLQRGMRPASFPGPMKLGESLDSATGGAILGTVQRRSMLKPPRHQSISDEDLFSMDGSTYRHLMQDLTSFKTMLFKLKRVIQEDEIGSPLNPAWKQFPTQNGYKLSAGSSTASTPPATSAPPPEALAKSSPVHKTVAPPKEDTSGLIEEELQPPNTKPIVEEVRDESEEAITPKENGLISPRSTLSDLDTPGSTLEEVIQVRRENAELRQQLQYMQRQLEEHERTIKLLQQQMEHALKETKRFPRYNSSFQNRTPRLTNRPQVSNLRATKYECGHLSPGGRAQNNAATQTDKEPQFIMNDGNQPRFGGAKGMLRPGGQGQSQADPVISSSGVTIKSNESERDNKKSVQQTINKNVSSRKSQPPPASHGPARQSHLARPSTTGSIRPAGARPGTSGSQRPSSAGASKTSLAGFHRPSATGSQRPSLTGTTRPNASGSQQSVSTSSVPPRPESRLQPPKSRLPQSGTLESKLKKPDTKSRVPSLSVQKVTKSKTQLRSFSSSVDDSKSGVS